MCAAVLLPTAAMCSNDTIYYPYYTADLVSDQRGIGEENGLNRESEGGVRIQKSSECTDE